MLGIHTKYVGHKNFYRFLVDRTKAERKADHTQNISRVQMEASGRTLTFINTPGKHSLVKNRICGITQADTALVVVDVTVGITPTLIEILDALKNLGISSLVFAINKLDKVQESEDGSTTQKSKYDAVVSALRLKLKKKFPGVVHFVPVSGSVICCRD
jgi:elongation factor 1-alpha